MKLTSECPYTDKPCPKLQELDDRIDVLEKNQRRLMQLVYYIAGIVSVSLGMTGGMVLI